MSRSKPAASTTTTQTAGLALLCSILAQYLASRYRQGRGQQESEVLSEAVCWAVLPVLFRISGKTGISIGSKFVWKSRPSRQFELPVTRYYYPRGRNQHHQKYQYSNERGPSVWSPGLVAWVVALGISVACLFRAEVGVIGLFPIVTPILLLVERNLQFDISEGWNGSLTKASPGPSLDHFRSLSALAISLLSIWVMLDGNTFATALSAIPTFALLIVYMSFDVGSSSTQGKHAFWKFIPRVEDLKAFIASGRISLGVILLLGMVLLGQIWSFGFPNGISFTAVFLAGLARAGSWYFIICTVQDLGAGEDDPEKHRERDTRLTLAESGTSWIMATLIGTFCLVASRDTSIQSSDFKALSQVISSLLVLGQIIHTLPRQPKATSMLWAFALVSIIPYLYHGFVLRQINSTSPSWTSARPHPAEALIRKATADFDKLLQRQSKTYQDVVSEYKRRYGIAPPPGFDKWYQLAVAHNSAIIDEFDTIFENVSPFLKLSGKEITKIVSKASKMPNIELWDCTFTSRDDKAMTQCIHPSRKYDRHISTMFDQMIHDLEGLWLPDVRFLVNHLDEPRAMFPPSQQPPEDADARVVAIEANDLSHKPTWDKLTSLCDKSTNKTSHSYPQQHEVNTYSLPLVTDRRTELDLCQHPEYRTLSGLFTSPTSFRLIAGLVPVLSTGAPSTMGDILIPSPAYSEPQFQYHAQSDVSWSQKRNTLYWAGSSTGGFASDDTSWPFFQRQRFVAKAQNLNNNLNSQSHTYMYLTQLGPDPDKITTSTTSILESRFYNVHFTKITQCQHPQCRAQRSYFRTTNWKDPSAVFHSKLAFDLDGNGISGRYYKLLASNSLPFKQTILREWHDERLWGWVHFIPVGLSLEEVPELVRYFLGTQGTGTDTDTKGQGQGQGRGEKIAKEVAERGKDWFAKGLRGVDRSLYLYRVVLELGRVMDQSREAWVPEMQ